MSRGGGVKRSVTLALGTFLLTCICIPIARAATEAERLTAIEKGLAYLYQTQQTEGYWSSPGYNKAATGAATFALFSQQDKWGNNTTKYQAAVDKAIGYLLNTATVTDVGTRNDGIDICPGGSTSCKAVYWYDTAVATYTTGLVAPAVAAYGQKLGRNVVATTQGPLAGMTWAEIAQGITNAFAANQSTSRNGDRDGGWRGFPGNGDSDSTTTHWAVTSLLYDETLGAITPQVVKNELKVWLGNVQHTSGAVCFQPGSEPCDHANTGGWLLAMRFSGYDVTNSQVQAALSFLNTQWQSAASNISYGNFGHPYAMWAVYSGLEATVGLSSSTHITNLLTDCNANGDPSGNAPCTWSHDYTDWLVKSQKEDGSWVGYAYWSEAIATALYLNILGAIPIPSLPEAGIPKHAGQSPQSQEPSARRTVERRASIVGRAASPPAAQTSPKAKKPRPFDRKGVTALAVKSDGSSVVSGSTDKTIRIWSTITGQEQVSLKGSLGLPTGVAIAGNGMLGSVGRDSVARIWDAAGGAELARLAGHEHAIRAVAISPDGKFLASAGEESRIIVWDLTNRKVRNILFGPTDFVNSVSFSPDGRLLATGGEDARVLIFDVGTGNLLRTLLGHSGPIDAVAFNPGSTVLASAGEDTVIHLWDAVNGPQLRVLTGHTAPVRSIAFSPDGKTLASGGENTQIILWDVASGAVNKSLVGVTGFTNVLAFDPKGIFLGSASDVGEITLWNVIAGVKTRIIKVP